MTNEFSRLSTGYSVYGKELLGRLHASGDYEVAELACCVGPGDTRLGLVPWRVYPDAPTDEEARRWYDASPAHRFGGYSFNRVCLDFRPDVVLDIRDPWMYAFIERSPFRRLFHWIQMPTVDSAPQAEQWLATLAGCDRVLTYTDWSREVLLREGGGLIDVRGVASPGADLESFRPHDRSRMRRRFNLADGSFIVGTVMRNQSRKLYPQLIDDFASFVATADPETAARSYLYMHVSYPDHGWDIPRLIKQSGVSHRILMTYKCRDCMAVFASFYADAAQVCPMCKGRRCTLPNASAGIDHETLGMIMSTFDVYVQYASCLAKGSEVLLKRGWTPIEQVQVGDEAFTHKGRYLPVTNTFVNLNKGQAYDIKVHSDYESVTATGEHPVLALTKDNVCKDDTRSLREYLGAKVKASRPIPDPVFVNVDQLKPGDLIAYGIDDTVVDVDRVDLSPWIRSDRDIVTNDTIEIKNGKDVPRYIDVDEEFCRFLGLYVANGSASGDTGTVCVTSHEDKVEANTLAEASLAKLVGREVSVGYVDGRHAYSIRTCSRPLGRYLRDVIRERSKKQLPEWAMHLPIEKQLEILRGWCMGDGCYWAPRKVSKPVTTSGKLASQVKQILRRARIYFNCRLVPRPGKRKPLYVFEIPGDVVAGELATKRSSSMSLYYGDYHFIQVKSIGHSDYDGNVYNFEVYGDNSYLTRIGHMHNCEGFGMPMVEAAACGVPIMATDYSAMESVVRSVGGHPIKPGWMEMDPDLGSYRARPDPKDFIEALKRHARMDPHEAAEVRRRTRKAVEDHYTWDRAVEVWKDAVESLPLRPWSETWDSPSLFHRPAPLDPTIESDAECVRWAIKHVLGRPDLVDSYMALRMTRDLNWAMRVGGGRRSYQNEDSVLGVESRATPYDRETMAAELAEICEEANRWERARSLKRFEGE